MAFQKGNVPWNKGKFLNEEYKKKLSEAHKGMHPITEWKKGHISWNKGEKPFDRKVWQKAYYKTYYQTHNEKIKANVKAYRDTHKEKIKIRRKEYMKKYMKGYILTYFKNRIKNDIRFRIELRLRSSLRIALKKYGNGKIYSSKKYGINYEACCKKLIETKPVDFNERKYHIDHAIPLSVFDLTDTKQIQMAFAPENLQWLTAEENLSKHDKII